MAEERIFHYRSNDLLATKMEVPLLASHIVERERLTRKLISGTEGLVTLIVAPAGYGKTTLLAEFLSSFLSPGWRSAWVSLDSYDNDLLQFWAYILASIQKSYPNLCFDLKQLLQDEDNLDEFDFMHPIINEIADIPHHICLILDDYQTITNDRIHRSLSYLVDHQPKNLRLILSSRKMPPIPLSRLRAQRLLSELSFEDLSFNLNETISFLSGVMNLDMFDDQVEILQDVTEGWIAGLQMAALSLQGKLDFHRLVHDLQGGSPHIFDYLTEEVLNQQDPKIRDFLLKTSILSEFSPSLCNAVTGRQDSLEYLTHIERSKLFVTPLDDKQNWYRYHHLFAETLRAHLHNEYPDLAPELYEKACDWCLENGLPDQAVTYALASSDIEKAAQIIDTCAMQAVIHFDLVKLVQYVSRFSDELLAQRPRLGIYYALANLHLGRIDRIEPKLQNLETILDQKKNNGADRRLIRWEIDATRAAVDCFYQDIPRGISNAIELKRNAPAEDVYFYGQLSHCLADAHAAQGNLDLAVQEYEEGIRFAEKNRLTTEYACSLYELAYVRKLQGFLQESEHLYRMLLDYIAQSDFCDDTMIFAQCGLAEIALEKNELANADRWMQPVLRDFDKVKSHRTTMFQYEWVAFSIVRYFLAHKEFDLARHYFREAMDSFRENPNLLHYLYSKLIRTQARYMAAVGYLPVDDNLFIQQLLTENPYKLCQINQQIADARFLLAKDDLDRSLETLTEITPRVRELGIREYLLECLILMALVSWRKHQRNLAHQILQEAIDIASQEGYIRMFIDEGEPLKDLLIFYDQRLQMDEVNPQGNAMREFISRIIAGFDPDQKELQYTEKQPHLKKLPDSPISEPLSDRELEVLEMRVRGNSNKEVAVALSISYNTVKTHLKNIYRKLDVHHFHELYHRVDELGILDHSPDHPN